MTSSVGAALCGRPGDRQAACLNRAATQGAYGILRTAPTEKPVISTLTAGLPEADAPRLANDPAAQPSSSAAGRDGWWGDSRRVRRRNGPDDRRVNGNPDLRSEVCRFLERVWIQEPFRGGGLLPRLNPDVELSNRRAVPELFRLRRQLAQQVTKAADRIHGTLRRSTRELEP